MKDQLQNQMTQLSAQRGNLAKALEQVDREIEKVGFGLQLIDAQEKQAEQEIAKAESTE